MKEIKFIKLFLSRLLERYLHQRIDILPKLLMVLFAILITFFVLKFGQIYPRQKSISEGIIGVYTHNNLPLSVTALISQPLVSLDKDGKSKPQVTSGWQVNNDATLYTFKLKNNLFWNDGSPVKSSDIKFNLSDIEVSYPDDSTIIFKLADSFYPFPALLTTPIFKKDSLVGMGEYKVAYEEINRNLITKLILNPKDKDLPIISIRFYPDEETAKIAFELGEIDSLINLTDTDNLTEGGRVSIKKFTNFNKLVAVFYNTKDSVLSEKNLRKALSLSIPKVTDEEGSKTSIQPYSWAYNDTVKTMTGDPDSAKIFLNKVPSDKIGTITLITIPQLSSLGQNIVESWKKIGVSALLRVENGVPQNFQALLIPQLIPMDPDQYALWHSTQTKTNLSKYSSPRIDKDLEDGRKTGDWEKRREKYLDFQKVLQDDVPATFLYFPKSLIVYRIKVEDSLNKILSLQIPQM